MTLRDFAGNRLTLHDMTPIQKQRYTLPALQQQTMIRRLHLSPELLEISGIYDMDIR